jgi:hypothetical protein
MIRRTYGSVKEQLARVTQNGMCPDSSQLLARTNEAQERLLNKGLYAGTYGRYSVCVYGGCITLPREFESILGYNYGGAAAQVYNQWYEFMANGPGTSPAGAWRQLQDRGFVPSFRPLDSQKYIRVYTDLAEDATSTILFRGSDSYNNRVQTIENGAYIDGERLNLSAGSGNSSVLVSGITGTHSVGNGVYSWVGTVNSKPAYGKTGSLYYIYSDSGIGGVWRLALTQMPYGDPTWPGSGQQGSSPTVVSTGGVTSYPWTTTWNFGPYPAMTLTELPRTTVNAFRSIDAINKTATKGWVRVYAVDPTTGSEYCIAILAPDETLPQYRRYAIPGHEREEGVAVTVLAKRKFIPVVTDDDDLIVTNLGALKMMAIAIEKEENNNLDEALKYEEKAVELLREELKEVEGANIGRPQVQMEAFAMGEIANMA